MSETGLDQNVLSTPEETSTVASELNGNGYGSFHKDAPGFDAQGAGQQGSTGTGDDGKIHANQDGNDSGFSFRKLWVFMGPGVLMSIAYIDPGNLSSDLQAGSIAKYKLLWVLMLSTVFGLILQLLAARLGCVTGMSLAEVCRQEYSRSPRLVLWVMIEVAIIGSDIQHVIGSAIAINLLSNNKVPLWAGVLITGLDTFTFLFLENYGLRKLEAVFGVLVATMVGTFLYMSRSIDRADRRAVKEANMYNSIESCIVLFVSFMINLFVMTVFADEFAAPEYTNPSLRRAGLWLYVKYGLAMKIIWGVGILAAGQSSTMTGTYAGQFVMQGFINLKWSRWKRVILTRSLAMLPTLIVALVATRDLELMNKWLNILQSVQIPFALLPIIKFTDDEEIMGEFKNGRKLGVIAWTIVLLVTGINFYLVALFVISDGSWYTYLIASLLSVVYVLFVVYLAMGPTKFMKIKTFIFGEYDQASSAIAMEEQTLDNPNHPNMPSEKPEVPKDPEVDGHVQMSESKKGGYSRLH